MSYVAVKTATGTYTVVNVRQVFEQFNSDLSTLCRRTKTRSMDWAEKTGADVLMFAEKDYLSGVSIVLLDKHNNRLRMKKYKVHQDAGTWDSDRPGGNRWPAPEGAKLQVVAHYSSTWSSLSDSQKSSFEGKLHWGWTPSSVNTREAGMTLHASRRYASQAYGLAVTDYRCA